MTDRIIPLTSLLRSRAMVDPIIIRASSLTGWSDCERRGAARIFRRIIEAMGYQLRTTPMGVGAAIGTAVHKAAAVVLDEKARRGALPPASVAEDCAAGEVTEAVSRGVQFDGQRGPTYNRDDALKQATRMARAYHSVIAPQVQPILIEERLEAEVATGLILSGQPDVVAREPGQIRDLKSGIRNGNHNAQIGAYSLLARSHGLDIETAAVDFIGRAAMSKPQPDPVSKPVPVAIAENAAAQIVRKMAADLRVFQQGDEQRRLPPGDPWAFTANPQSNLCSARWCVAFGTDFCREHEGATDA
jgi:hypothetical protein